MRPLFLVKEKDGNMDTAIKNIDVTVEVSDIDASIKDLSTIYKLISLLKKGHGSVDANLFFATASWDKAEDYVQMFADLNGCSDEDFVTLMKSQDIFENLIAHSADSFLRGNSAVSKQYSGIDSQRKTIPPLKFSEVSFFYKSQEDYLKSYKLFIGFIRRTILIPSMDKTKFIPKVLTEKEHDGLVEHCNSFIMFLGGDINRLPRSVKDATPTPVPPVVSRRISYLIRKGVSESNKFQVQRLFSKSSKIQSESIFTKSFKGICPIPILVSNNDNWMDKDNLIDNVLGLLPEVPSRNPVSDDGTRLRAYRSKLATRSDTLSYRIGKYARSANPYYPDEKKRDLVKVPVTGRLPVISRRMGISIPLCFPIPDRTPHRHASSEKHVKKVFSRYVQNMNRNLEHGGYPVRVAAILTGYRDLRLKSVREAIGESIRSSIGIARGDTLTEQMLERGCNRVVDSGQFESLPDYMFNLDLTVKEEFQNKGIGVLTLYPVMREDALSLIRSLPEGKEEELRKVWRESLLIARNSSSAIAGLFRSRTPTDYDTNPLPENRVRELEEYFESLAFEVSDGERPRLSNNLRERNPELFTATRVRGYSLSGHGIHPNDFTQIAGKATTDSAFWEDPSAVDMAVWVNELKISAAVSSLHEPLQEVISTLARRKFRG